MTSIRLTKTIKEKILEELIKYNFQERYDQLDKEFYCFSQRIYQDVYRNKIEDFYALKEGWLPESNSIRVTFSGRHDYVYFDGSMYSKPHQIRINRDEYLNKKMRIPYKDVNNTVKQYEANDKLTQEYDKLTNKAKDLYGEFETVKHKTSAALDSVTTVNSLIKMWPEVKPFLEGIIDLETKTKALAIPKAELNRLLNLPKKDAA